MKPAPQNTARAPLALHLGPDPVKTGGMASVVNQLLHLAYQGRYRAALFPMTLSDDSAEKPWQRALRHWRHLRGLRRRIRSTDARIVHVHTCSGFSFYRSMVDMLMARRLGCRTVLHIHGAGFDRFHASSGRIGKWVIRLALAKADRVIALSRNWAGKLNAMSPRSHICVVQNAVAPPASLTARTDTGRCRFLVLAKMDTWKGIDDLLDACAGMGEESREVEVVLAGPPGSAGDAAVMEEKIRMRSLGNIVSYVGNVYGDQKDRLLRWADVYVQPSHQEGLPIALLEAISYGLPVVATGVGAIPEVITHHREGMLVAPHEPPELANAMLALARDPGKRRAMSKASRERACTRFCLSRLEEDLIRLYDELSESPQTSTVTSTVIETKSQPQWFRKSARTESSAPCTPADERIEINA